MGGYLLSEPIYYIHIDAAKIRTWIDCLPAKQSQHHKQNVLVESFLNGKFSTQEISALGPALYSVGFFTYPKIVLL